jgi:putative FmdB family regulatory protein
MPLYEYKCKKCKKEFELMRKMSDEPLEKCIHCNGAVEKLISRAAFHLKGGGWFDSGYSKSDPSSACKDSSNAGASGAGGSGTGVPDTSCGSGTGGCPKAS